MSLFLNYKGRKIYFHAEVPAFPTLLRLLHHYSECYMNFSLCNILPKMEHISYLFVTFAMAVRDITL